MIAEKMGGEMGLKGKSGKTEKKYIAMVLR